MRISLAGFGLLVGCVTQENYWPRYAAAHCDIIKECGQRGIHETYDSMAQCRRSYRESYADLTPCYADCDFDADKAAECLESLRSPTCAPEPSGSLATPSPACDQVFDCEGAASYEACYGAWAPNE